MRSTETYTPSLHDALPICRRAWQSSDQWWRSLTTAEKESFGQEQKQIQADYAAAYEESLQPGDERVRAVTTRLHRWLSGPVPTITRERSEERRVGQEWSCAGVG